MDKPCRTAQQPRAVQRRPWPWRAGRCRGQPCAGAFAAPRRHREACVVPPGVLSSFVPGRLPGQGARRCRAGCSPVESCGAHGCGAGAIFLFLTAALLVFLGWRALLTYLPSMVVELGGGSRQQGFLMAEMSLCSMAAMGLYPRLRRRLGVRAFLLAGAAFMAVRVLCMAFVRTLPALAAVQLLEAVSYGFFQPAAMGMSAPSRRRGARHRARHLYCRTDAGRHHPCQRHCRTRSGRRLSARRVSAVQRPGPRGPCALLFLLFRAGPYAAAQKEAV